ALQNSGAPNIPLNNPGMMGNVDPSAADLLSTASAIYQTDPKQAMELAQRAFALGVPSSAPGFLNQMYAKDPVATDQLYQFALTQLGNNPNATPGQVLLLASYPFGSGQVWLVDGNRNTMSMAFPPPKNFKMSPALVNQFLGTAMSVISRAGDMDPSQSSDVASFVGSALFAAKILQPRVAAYQPALQGDLANLTAKLTQLSSVASQEQIDKVAQNVAASGNPKDPNDPSNSASNAASPGLPGFGPSLKLPGDTEDNVKKLLEQAENAADPGAKDDLYQQAALTVQRIGDIDRAMNIGGKISDAGYKAS